MCDPIEERERLEAFAQKTTDEAARRDPHEFARRVALREVRDYAREEGRRAFHEMFAKQYEERLQLVDRSTSSSQLRASRSSVAGNLGSAGRLD
ncbi:MAG: hypothetical protein RL885_10815 [Planctomycetota bacterium]